MNKLIKILFNLIFIVLFIFLLTKLDLRVLARLKEINLFILLGVIILLFLSVLLKSIRFKLLNPSTPLLQMLRITVIHNFYLTLLPFRLGELAYMKKLKELNIKFTKSFSDLVICRSLDLIVLGILFDIFIYYYYFKGVYSETMVIVITLIILALSLVYLFPKIITKPFKRTKLHNSRLIYLKKKIIEILENFNRISYPKRISLFVFSFLVILASFLPYSLIIISLAKIPFIETIIANTFALLSSILPISPPGGVGLIEGGWVVGFSLFHLDTNLAITLGLILHSVQIVSIIVIYFTFRILFRKHKH